MPKHLLAEVFGFATRDFSLDAERYRKNKQGENGKGLKSRWYPTTLQKRIQAIARMKDYISFITGDGMKILRDHAEHLDTVFFIDPPYTAGVRKQENAFIHILN